MQQEFFKFETYKTSAVYAPVSRLRGIKAEDRMVTVLFEDFFIELVTVEEKAAYIAEKSVAASKQTNSDELTFPGKHSEIVNIMFRRPDEMAMRPLRSGRAAELKTQNISQVTQKRFSRRLGLS